MVETEDVFDYAKYRLAEIINKIKETKVYDKVIEFSAQSANKISQNKLPNYNGNYITCDGRSILAMAGPRDNNDLNILLHHLLDSANPITQLIVLITNDSDSDKFYANYFQLNYPLNCADFDVTKSITMINNHCAIAREEIDYQKQCIETDFIVVNKKDHKKTTLKVCSIPVMNGSSIVAPGSPKRSILCSEKNKPFITCMLNYYLSWLKKGNIAVHCELGFNRSAHFAMINFFLADFESVFQPQDTDKTVQNIENKAKQIMSQRDKFCPNLFQFLDAIDITVMMKVALVSLKLQKPVTHNHELIDNPSHLSSMIANFSLWSDATQRIDSALNEELKNAQNDKIESKPVESNICSPSG